MNRSDLIDTVAAGAGLSKADATKAVDALFEGITEALKRNEEVKLAGFGVFSVAERAAREGRNPSTGEPIQVPASRAVKFKAGKQLKDGINP